LDEVLERSFVWLGGAVFVGALALCAWAFFAAWATVRPFEGWQAVGWNAALFSVFATHHSLFARDAIKRRLGRLFDQRLIRSVYVWTASLLLISLILAWQPVGGALYRVGRWPAVINLLAQAAGFVLIVMSVRSIDPLELAGIHVDQSGGLLDTGPYAIVRHPLYLGWTLIVFGPASMTGDRLTFGLLTTAYLAIAVRWEERSLGAELGAAYESYKARVRWRIVPYVY
jgi:protein-S-isoprenylcysteine O-methyltransferase Ste14